MKFYSMKNVGLVAVMAVCLAAAGCSDRWISVALEDLPVLVQMALNLGTLAAAVEGKTMSVAETASIQNIAAEAGKDLNLLETLYNDYKQNPNATSLQKIDDGIATLEQNLTGLLAAAHIGDPVTAQRVTAGVNLILTTVESFAALMPQSSARAAARARNRIQIKSGAGVPTAKELKAQWNVVICGGLSGCVVR